VRGIKGMRVLASFLNLLFLSPLVQSQGVDIRQ